MANLEYSGGYDSSIAKLKETTKNAYTADASIKEGFQKIDGLDSLGEKLSVLTRQAGETITGATTAVAEALDEVTKILVQANDDYIRLNEGGY